MSSLALSITVDIELNSSLSELETRGDWHSSMVAVEISSITQSGLLARPRSRGVSSFKKLLIVSLSLAGLSLNCENWPACVILRKASRKYSLLCASGGQAP